ncbi:UTP:RNA uridylyltransferase 1 [Phytophthora citrophthora]|uniref:UTP:RNA uridylyltransferase 1 n=1 Tax=Phytophthora citrophthora TaxID=4793 RepID=A0AAD9LJS8_9STRA|nr:UTP:RNA uridylyltransferase 1 [Phytophthora citrophthora]
MMVQFSPQERVALLATACERLSGAFQVQEFVRNARVPVLKLWDPQWQVACDVCVGGINTLLNTALLKCYGQVDPRVRPLVFAVKYWAKQRGINDPVNGTLSSYGEPSLLFIVIICLSQYAEMQLPAVLSLFQDLQSQTKVSKLLERLQKFPTVEFSSTFGTSEMNSVGALLAGFFDFYAHRFNMEDEVASIRVGRALPKTTKWSHPVSWRLSIEDPFELAHDVGRVIFHEKGQELIRSEFKRASDLLRGDHRLVYICEPDMTSWNIISTCYICRGRDHATRDCGQLAHQRLRSGVGNRTMSHFSDCWYCGEYGHYKAECPMLFFRNIPKPVEVADSNSTTEATTQSGSISRMESAPASPPKTIPVPPTSKSISPRSCKERPWERGLSPNSSPMLRLSRKKKRSRHGSMSSNASLPPSSSWSPQSSDLSQSEKRQQQHRYQQQRQELRRRNFALLEPTQKCGGNARSGKAYMGKVLCPS